jgi:Fic family protein
MKYNWQLSDWPKFRYDSMGFQADLYRYAEATGRLAGSFPHLPPELQEQATLELMVAEAIKTSAIEGEFLEREDVMSSIRNNLNLNHPLVLVKDDRAQGIGWMMVDVRQSYKDALSEKTLFQLHQMLMYVAKGTSQITIGAWRTHSDPMQVISGWPSKVKVHFEAPPSKEVPLEMARFIDWFNRTAPGQPDAIVPGPLRAAVAHLYFESIHPFEDGNGRLGRALAEKALSQDLGRPALISLSSLIDSQRKRYYEALKQGQQSNEITAWVAYFIRTVLEAQQAAEKLIEFTLGKAKFFDQFKAVMNERQQKVVARMLKEGPEGFKGGMNAAKYMNIAHCSKATATRDLADLQEKKIFMPPVAGGRSTSYSLTALSEPR